MDNDYIKKIKELLKEDNIVFDSDDTLYLIIFLFGIDSILNLLINLLGD